MSRQAGPRRPDDLPTGSLRTVLRRVVSQIEADELTDRAAALTYYGIQAIFPGVLVLVSVVGLLGHGTTQSLIQNLEQIAPDQVANVLRTAITNAQSHRSAAGVLGIVGILLALWSASGYVAAFMRAANRIYAMPEGRPVWKTAPVRLAITIFTVIVLVAGLVIVMVSGTVADRVGHALGIGSTGVLIWNIAKWPVLVLLVAIMLAVLYWAAPNVRHGGVRWVTPGSAMAVVVWLVASGLFATYVANFGSYNKTYGSVAAVIIFLVWLWISNLAILLGLELDAELDHERAIQQGVPEDTDLFAIPKDERKLQPEAVEQARRTREIRQSRR